MAQAEQTTSGDGQIAVMNNAAESRYEARVDGHLAVIEYTLPGNDRISMNHTGVPEVLSGRGVGSQLAKFALDDARARGLKVIPMCPFVAAYIRRHPDYLDLVPEEERGLVTARR